MSLAGAGQALPHLSGAEACEPPEQFRNANSIYIGKGNPQLMFSVRRSGGLEHGAGQHQDGSIGDKAFGQLI